MRLFLLTLWMASVACEPCRPLPCPYPGWDPDTCSCRSGGPLPHQDAEMDATSGDGGEDVAVRDSGKD
jgi:hypothetical protein